VSIKPRLPIYGAFDLALAVRERILIKSLRILFWRSATPTKAVRPLSGRAKKTVYAAVIAPNLQAAFYVEEESVVTIDIGSHDIYR
jgi:hypothetical protein